MGRTKEPSAQTHVYTGDWADRFYHAFDVNVSREVAEACLAHVVKGVEASYQRSDLFERRRSVMQKWSDYVTGAPSADVIPLHGWMDTDRPSSGPVSIPIAPCLGMSHTPANRLYA